LLWWDRDGLTLYYRRLEEGTFRFPTTNDPDARSIEVSSQELSLVLWGIDPASVKRQKRYQRTAWHREKSFTGSGNNLAADGISLGMSTDATPQLDPALLPDDPALLKALVMQLLEELRKANARLERQEHHMKSSSDRASASRGKHWTVGGCRPPNSFGRCMTWPFA
jgi:hypothetical protein